MRLENHEKQQLSDKFIRQMARCLHKEEIDAYMLNLYNRYSEDMNYFRPKDRRRVKRIFDVLIKETKEHGELLRLVLCMRERR